jgi:hypothetical protein
MCFTAFVFYLCYYVQTIGSLSRASTTTTAAAPRVVVKMRGDRRIWPGPTSNTAQTQSIPTNIIANNTTAAYADLRVNDLIDAMDKEKNWFESFVVDVRTTDGAVKVHFMGWGSKWDGMYVLAARCMLCVRSCPSVYLCVFVLVCWCRLRAAE